MITSSNHDFEPGDLVMITSLRYGLINKILDAIVGIYYYNSLPRSLIAFVIMEPEKCTVLAFC